MNSIISTARRPTGALKSLIGIRAKSGVGERFRTRTAISALR